MSLLDRETTGLHEIQVGTPPTSVIAQYPNFCINTVNSTDGAETWTAAQVLGGLITRTIGAARSDVTPTAAFLITAMGSPTVGESFMFTVRNATGSTHVLTVTAGNGVTLAGVMTLAATASRTFVGYVTSATTITIVSIT
jgi:hypothetical protein